MLDIARRDPTLSDFGQDEIGIHGLPLQVKSSSTLLGESKFESIY